METTFFISETVSDRAKQILFSTTVGLLTTKLQLLKISILGHMTSQGHMPRKCKLAVISETVKDREKQSKFSNPVGLLHTKLQLLKIPILGHPSRSHDLGTVNCPLFRKP